MNRSKIKVITVLGTRPEMIRLARVAARLDEVCNHIIVHTGQNHDYELYQIFLDDLKIRKPDYFLGIDTTSIGRILGETLTKTEKVLIKEKPDAVLILGDTNSSIAGLLAKKLRIPLFHMEAGNRCFDQNVPEEVNRKVIDHIADFNLVYTEHARRNLLAEGFPSKRIFLTGSPMLEVLSYYQSTIKKSKINKQLKVLPRKYFVASFHRAENVDNQENLSKILRLLSLLSEEHGLPIICSIHPRTKQAMEKAKKEKISKNVRLLAPFKFSDYVALQQKALCVISDSGTISEESAILRFPAVIIRNATERPEALDAGTVSLTGLDAATTLDSINLAISMHKSRTTPQIPREYTETNTSWKVARLILGLCKLSNPWHGIPDKTL